MKKNKIFRTGIIIAALLASLTVTPVAYAATPDTTSQSGITTTIEKYNTLQNLYYNFTTGQTVDEVLDAVDKTNLYGNFFENDTILILAFNEKVALDEKEGEALEIHFDKNDKIISQTYVSASNLVAVLEQGNDSFYSELGFDKGLYIVTAASEAHTMNSKEGQLDFILELEKEVAKTATEQKAKPSTSKTQATAEAKKEVKEETTKVSPSTNNVRSTVYWVMNGDKYHARENCTTLKRSKKIYSSSIQEAINKGKTEPCSVCYR